MSAMKHSPKALAAAAVCVAALALAACGNSPERRGLTGAGLGAGAGAAIGAATGGSVLGGALVGGAAGGARTAGGGTLTIPVGFVMRGWRGKLDFLRDVLLLLGVLTCRLLRAARRELPCVLMGSRVGCLGSVKVVVGRVSMIIGACVGVGVAHSGPDRIYI